MNLRPDPAPYDALLFLSFGGPEGPGDVIPFLRNVTRGRDIPAERLAEVGEHYLAFGGVSPINQQCRELIAAIEAEFAAHGLDLPVYWGNRNWEPYLPDALRRMAADGVRRAIVFVTSAYASYSGCRQYRENLAAALARVREAGASPPALDKLRHYFNHPGFVEPMVRRTLEALERLPAGVRAKAHLAFTTHSIPLAQAESAGPRGGDHGDHGDYVAQHLEVAAEIADRVRVGTGFELPWRLVYQSRSGPPTQPWLEPDIRDHLAAVRADGVTGVVIVPIGFISDHMEVRYDLDVQAVRAAAELGLPMVRAATVGTDPSFVRMVRELVLERAAGERGERPPRPALGPGGPSHDVCPAGCCPNLRACLPTAAGAG